MGVIDSVCSVSRSCESLVGAKKLGAPGKVGAARSVGSVTRLLQ